MKKYSIFAVFVLCVSLLAVSAKAVTAEPESPYQVGEKWVYKHEGPKIERWELDHFEGERTKEVISIEKSNGKKHWVIKENYGANDFIQIHYYVDGKKLVGKFKIFLPQFGVFTTVNKPAYPFDWASLNIGEEKEFKSQRTIEPFYSTYPLSVKFKRLEDQTVEVPAGKFKNCLHFKVSLSYTEETEASDFCKTSIKQNTDLWYHPKVNGIVKQITQSGPFEYMGEIRQGYTVTNVLKSYSKGK